MMTKRGGALVLAVVFWVGFLAVAGAGNAAQKSIPDYTYQQNASVIFAQGQAPNRGSAGVNPFPHPPLPGGVPLVPPPPGSATGPVVGHPFANPKPIPSPGANGVPPRYEVVPQQLPGVPGLPGASPGSQPTSMWSAFQKFVTLLVSPATAFAACEGVIDSSSYWDCDTPTSIITQFEGGGPGSSGSPGSYWIPPDTDGAVGSNDVVTFVNGAYYVWDKSGSLLTETDAVSFWCSHYNNLPNGCNPVDPKIVHDVNGGDSRWIASSLAGVGAAAQTTLIAVSTGEDPTSYLGWYFYSVPSCGGGGAAGDQPKLGFNAQWAVAFVDCPNGGNTVWAFDKANLYAGGSITNKVFGGGGTPNYQQPAIQAQGTSFNAFLVGINDPIIPCSDPFGCFTSATFNSLAIGLITGPTDSPTFYQDYYTITLSSAGYILAPAGAQLGTNVLAGNEQALVNSATVQLLPPYGFEYIYAAFPLGLPASSPSRSAVEWVQVDDLGNLVQRGVVQDTTNAKSYHTPSIAVSPYGYGLLGYSDFSKGYYPRGDYTVLDLNLPASGGVQTYTPDEDLNFASGTVVSSQAYWAGGSCVCNKFRCVAGGAYTCARWGDYSTSASDPYTTNLWTIQEYINVTPIPPPSAPADSGPAPTPKPTPGSLTIQDTGWLEVSTGQ